MLILTIIYTDTGNQLFGTAPLPLQLWLLAITFALILGFAEELRKGLIRWQQRANNPETGHQPQGQT